MGLLRGQSTEYGHTLVAYTVDFREIEASPPADFTFHSIAGYSGPYVGPNVNQ